MLRAVAREWLSWVYPFVCEIYFIGLGVKSYLYLSFHLTMMLQTKQCFFCRLRGTGGGFLHPVRIMPPLRGVSPLF